MDIVETRGCSQQRATWCSFERAEILRIRLSVTRQRILIRRLCSSFQFLSRKHADAGSTRVDIVPAPVSSRCLPVFYVHDPRFNVIFLPSSFLFVFRGTVNQSGRAWCSSYASISSLRTTLCLYMCWRAFPRNLVELDCSMSDSASCFTSSERKSTCLFLSYSFSFPRFSSGGLPRVSSTTSRAISTRNIWRKISSARGISTPREFWKSFSLINEIYPGTWNDSFFPRSYPRQMPQPSIRSETKTSIVFFNFPWLILVTTNRSSWIFKSGEISLVSFLSFSRNWIPCTSFSQYFIVQVLPEKSVLTSKLLIQIFRSNFTLSSLIIALHDIFLKNSLS